MFKRHIFKTTLLAAVSAFVWMPLAMAANEMPASQQNELIQKYCAVCHSDAHMNGGLSLEHFDASRPDPGVAAMILSKLTSGIPLQRVRAVQTDSSAAELVANKMKSGAMGAAGIPVPDRETQDALVRALSIEAGVGTWTVNRLRLPKTLTPALTASIVQEIPSPTIEGTGDLYRLTITCTTDTHKGDMQLAWAPGVPKQGQVMSAAADDGKPAQYTVEGHEKMGNTGTGDSGPGAIVLAGTALPKKMLTITNLFDKEKVVIPFGGLDRSARKGLSACFK